jgi:hypothetical protein
MENPKNKISFIIGLSSACIGYSFHQYLWNDAFFHLMSLSFVAYSFIVFNKAKSQLWRTLTFSSFIVSCNILFDEFNNNGFIFDFTEILSLIIILIYIFTRKFK